MLQFDITPEMNKQLQEIATAQVNKEYKTKLDELSHLNLDSYKQDTFGLSKNLEEPNPLQVSALTSSTSNAVNKESEKVIEQLPQNGENAIGEYKKTMVSKQLDYIVHDKRKEILSQFDEKAAAENDIRLEAVKENTETNIEAYKQDKTDKKYQKNINDIKNNIHVGNSLSYNGANYDAPDAAKLNTLSTELALKLAGNKKGKEYNDNKEKYSDYLSQTELTKTINDAEDKKSLFIQNYKGTDPDTLNTNVSTAYNNIQTTISSNSGSNKTNAAQGAYKQSFFPEHIQYEDTGKKRQDLKKDDFKASDDNEKRVVKTDPYLDFQVVQGLSQPRYPNTNGFEHYLENLGKGALNGLNSVLDKLAGEGMGLANDLFAAQDDPATRDPLVKYVNKAIGILNDKYSVDAMDNAFDVYLIYTPDMTDFKSPLRNMIRPLLKLKSGDTYSKFFTNLTTPTVFGVRVTGITVPQVKLDTISHAWLSRDITKPGKPRMVSSSSFTFRLDQNMFYANIFEQFAGLNSMVIGSSTAPAGGEPGLNSNTTQKDSIMKQNTIPRSNSWKGNINIPHLCIYVRLRNLATPWKKLQKVRGPYADSTHMTDPSIKSTLGDRNLVDINDVSPALPDDQMPGYLFEDVNILGSSDVELDVGGGDGPAEMTVNFTFRRCYKTRLDATKLEQQFKY